MAWGARNLISTQDFESAAQALGVVNQKNVLWDHLSCRDLCGNQIYGAFVTLHAIDATPARWRGDAGSSPLDRAKTATPSPRNDLVKNCRCTRHTG